MNPMDVVKTVTKLGKRLDALEKSSKGGKGDQGLTAVSVNAMIQRVLKDAYVQNNKDMKLWAGKHARRRFGGGLRHVTAAVSAVSAVVERTRADAVCRRQGEFRVADRASEPA
jgi:hypothetical protein